MTLQSREDLYEQNMQTKKRFSLVLLARSRNELQVLIAGHGEHGQDC